MNMNVCLNCKFNALSSSEDRVFYDIFSEIGIELQLVTLVEKYFHIDVHQIEECKICDNCLDHLIELFDMDEHLKNDKNSKNDEQIKNISADSKVEEDQLDAQSNKTSIVIEVIPQTDFEMTMDDNTNEGELIEGAEEIKPVQSNNSNEDALLLSPENNDNSQSFDEDYIIEELEVTENEKNNNGEFKDNIPTETEDEVCFEIIDDNKIEINSNDVLIEGPCSQDYDTINIDSYLDQAITTKFGTLEFSWSIICAFCRCTYNTLKELLIHPCVIKQCDEKNLKCPICSCNINITTAEVLARHLVIKHYNNLESLQVYGSCPECSMTFSNFIRYNKHSCCRHLKRVAGVRNFCTYCKLEFPSLKRYIFHMQFHQSKCRPKVCLICEATFNNSNDFFVHVQYSHEPKNVLACSKCDRFFKDRELYEPHIKKHDSQDGYYCAYCNQKYEHRHNLSNHMEMYHSRQVKRYCCKQCNKIFVGTQNYRKHLPFHSQKTNIQSYACSQCGLISRSNEEILYHIENSSNCPEARLKELIISATYYCENCGLDFASIVHLRKHRLTPGHNNELFRCTFCGKFYNEFRCVRSHMKTHKKYVQQLEAFSECRMYVCNIENCQDVYPIWSSLYYHKKKPHLKSDDKQQRPNLHVCQFCKKECPTKMSLAVHVARSHNTKNIKCPHCKNLYKNEKALQIHIDYMHTKIKCDSCFKTIKNRRNFEIHERVVHKRTQRYHCNQCPKGFYHKSELENHLKHIHTDVIYKCNKCYFTTSYKNSLDIHMAKHDNQMAFQCNFCRKSFTRKQILETHIKKHHQKKEFICKAFIDMDCEAAFATRYDLKNHIQKCHLKSHSKNFHKNHTKRSTTNIVRVQEISDHCQNEDNSNEKIETMVQKKMCLNNFEHSANDNGTHDIEKINKESDLIVEYLDEYFNDTTAVSK